MPTKSKPMQKVTPNEYIRLNKKLCNVRQISIVRKLAGEWLISPEQVCYRLLEEAIAKENYKREKDS